MNPFIIPGIAQEVEAMQKRQQDLLKSQSEVDAATSAYRDYLASQQNQPQFQMPQVQPNKTAAGIGAALALIGALTGDKRAVPAFGQFAGGLQGNAEAQRQRLLQEQQIKMQNQAQKDKAIGQLLGFDLENAQAKYSQESKSQQILREQKQKSAEAVKDRQFELEKIGLQNAGRKEIEGIKTDRAINVAELTAENRVKVAQINKSGRFHEVKAYVDSGMNFNDAVALVYDTATRESKQGLMDAQAKAAAEKAKLTAIQTQYYPQKFALDKAKNEATAWFQGESLKLRAATEARLQAGGGKAPSFKFEDDPMWVGIEGRVKSLGLERAGHDAKNVEYASDLAKAEGYQEGPEKDQLIKFYKDQIALRAARIREIDSKAFALRKDQLAREKAITDARLAGNGSRASVGGSPPSMAGQLKPGRLGPVAPLNPMTIPGAQYRATGSKANRPLGIFKPRQAK